MDEEFGFGQQGLYLQLLFLHFPRKLHLRPKAVGVGTYARHIPNTIAFGIQAPWQTDQCHQANEHVTVNDFMQWTAIIKEYIEAFCKLICVNESD